ncbi:MAG: malonyl-ACP O-methyltransferase BioC [Methylococcales bacterium]|nr:malonyl-ACP O-methyltransferase BioC [Methylococcales bacterium]
MYLDKTWIKRSFAAASMTYDSVAALQRTVGKELLHSVDAAKLNGTLLDLGCGTGFLTGELLAHSSHENLIALDIAWPMLQATRIKLAGKPVIYLCADAERLPLADQSIDHIFSNLALQWCRNLDAIFNDIKQSLKPDGRLAFSTFGPKTLHELKHAWISVDHYNHVNEFHSETQLKQFLQQTEFQDIHIETKLYTSCYDSVWILMQELKHLGAHHVIAGRNKRITTKTAMQQMIEAYELLRANDQIPATFEVIIVTAKV